MDADDDLTLRITFSSTPADEHGSVSLPISIATPGAPVILFALTHPDSNGGALGLDAYSLGWDGLRTPEELIEWMEATIGLLKETASGQEGAAS